MNMSKLVLTVVFLCVASYAEALVWSDPLPIGIEGLSGADPVGSTNDSGEAVIAWIGSIGGENVVQSSQYSEGAWGLPFLRSAVGDALSCPAVAINQAGDVILVWQKYDGANYSIQWSLYASAIWSTPQTLISSQYPIESIGVELNDNGDALLIWTAAPLGDKYILQSSTFSGGAWATVQDVSLTDCNAYKAKLALNDGGDSVVVWECNDGSSLTIEAARSVALGAWSSPETISESSIDSFLPQVSIMNNGEALAIWESTDEYNLVQVSSLVSDTWSTPETISTAGVNAENPDLSLNNNGNAIVVWGQYNGVNQEIMSARKLQGGWQNPVVISQPGFDCRAQKVVLNDSEEAICTWRTQVFSNYYNYITQSVGFSSEVWETPLSTGEYTDLQKPNILLNSMGVVWGFCNCEGYVVVVGAHF